MNKVLDSDMIQLDYDEKERTLTLNLPVALLDKLDHVIVTKFKTEVVGAIGIPMGRS